MESRGSSDTGFGWAWGQIKLLIKVGPEAIQQYEELVEACGSKRSKGIPIEGLPDEHQALRALLAAVDKDEDGRINLPEFMAISAFASMARPRRRRDPPLDLNAVVFELFAAVDEDLDGRLSGAQWAGLRKVLVSLGLLPPNRLDGIIGDLDLVEFQALCRKHLNLALILDARG